MRFCDDRIRFRYFMDPRKEIIGKFSNSSETWNKTKTTIDTITLKRTSGYKNSFNFGYNNDELLSGVRTY